MRAGSEVSGSLVMALLIASSLLLVCDAKKHLRLINKSNSGQIMMERCYSSEDDLGVHYIQPGQPYEFVFNDNFFCSTKFVCTVQFPSGVPKDFLAYSCKRDNDDCVPICEWTVTEDSICRSGEGEPICF
ncbi:hypothetical protein QQ045_005054 [Rhodiola kirilowii]